MAVTSILLKSLSGMQNSNVGKEQTIQCVGLNRPSVTEVSRWKAEIQRAVQDHMLSTPSLQELWLTCIDQSTY